MPESFETLVLNRLAFGPRPGDVAALRQQGFQAWLQQQLAPPAGDDPMTASMVATARLPILYTDPATGDFVVQQLPLSHLTRSTQQLWPLQDFNQNPILARTERPREEVRSATFIRAAYGTYQLREVMVHFWHNHFTVNAEGDNRIAVTLPVYDRIMRANALGNFRALLGQVAKSTAMLYYLNNASSDASHPDENYARELMELHTLGIDAYLGRDPANHDPSGNTGYSDVDVLEVARVLTGWTIADGRYTSLNNGTFIFTPARHDTRPKRALGLIFPGNEGVQEGERLLDRLARHPLTARFIAKKLVRYFVSDNPPAALVDRAAQAFLSNVSAPNQMAAVVHTIVTSAEFAASAGQKTKDPFQFMASFLRGTGLRFNPHGRLWENLKAMGRPQFAWGTPAGAPDVGAAWTNTNSLLMRWNAAFMVLEPFNYGINRDQVAPTPASVNSAQAALDYWVERLLGDKATAETRNALLAYANSAEIGGSAAFVDHRRTLSLWRFVSAVGSAPEFQLR
ncbi:MAG TPA: DUF1800 domain-containing protein [Azospirillaceae bacterium]|nr:DUF1800 domain-containing protein [Azospirillaceae bacterium]